MASIINSSNSSLSNITQLARLPVDEVIIYIVVLCTGVIGFIINLVAIMMITIQDKVKTASDGLVFHLMFCDLIAAVVLAASRIVVLYDNSIGLPYQVMDEMCKAQAFAAPMSYVLTVATLSLMSVERYRAVIYPLKPRMNGKKVVVILLPIWLLSTVVAIISVSETKADPLHTSYCIYNSNETHSYIIIIGVIYLALVGYIIPLIVMLYCYTKIITKLKLLATITESHRAKESNTQTRRKRIITTLIAVSAIFMSTGIPTVIGLAVNIYNFSRASNLTVLEKSIGSIFISVGVILLILAVTCNPIIYFVRKRENCNLTCYNKVHTISGNKKGNSNTDGFHIKRTHNTFSI